MINKIQFKASHAKNIQISLRRIYIKNSDTELKQQFRGRKQVNDENARLLFFWKLYDRINWRSQV